MKTTTSSRGRIVLPAKLRQMDGIEPGQEFDVERLGRGDYRLVRRAGRQNQGAIDWLLSCPQKDFFVPIGLGPDPRVVGGSAHTSRILPLIL